MQPGDTLSGIAARFAVRGGWPALYAANRPLIGPDPDVIRPGTVLVLPGSGPARYRVAAGDTLSGIAAALAVRGGWPALYAANRRVIGPDPDVIRPGTVLTVPRPAARAGRAKPGPPVRAAVGAGWQRAPARAGAGAAAGMPRWLKTVLLAAGLLVGAAFLAEPVLAVRRRRAACPGARAARAARATGSGAAVARAGPARGSPPGGRPASSWPTMTGWW